MSDLMERFARIGIAVPEVLLPKVGTDLSKWSVIACDQFTSDKAYWGRVAEAVGNAPSTLNLMLPEAYLDEKDQDVRVERINAIMRRYLDEGVLAPREPGFVLVDRRTAHVPSRKGLVLAVDLEAYSFEKGSLSLIRPTEGTILDRLPPRMKIRRGAALDLPHILLLIDDPEQTVIEPLFDRADSFETLYDFDLLEGGGHLRGHLVPTAELEPTLIALEKLAEGGFLFAAGDGNHSLATAKQLWEEKKAAGAPSDHPARYALVEIENIYDRGLPFHPIHRVLFGVDPAAAKAELARALGGAYEAGLQEESPGSVRRVLGVIDAEGEESLIFPAPEGRLTVEPLQEFLDRYLKEHGGTIDYIHGEDAVKRLAAKQGNLGLILPPVDKGAFFRRIVRVGPYPRKTFSIGEAAEKRHYLESRRLIPRA
jgi:hypothetical protein